MKLIPRIFYVGIFISTLISSRQISQAYFHPSIQVETIINPDHVNAFYTSLPLDKQVSLLLILIDTAQKPQLMGVWWVALAPQAPITFIPVFPSTKEDATYTQELVSHYKLVKGKQQNRELNPAFLTHIKTKDIPLDGYIVLDQSALEILVNFLGGINLDEHTLDGKQVVTRFVNPHIDPEAALIYQSGLWEQICQKAVFAGSSGIFEIVRPELAQHSITSPGLPVNFSSFQTYITNQDSISCSVNPAGRE